MRNVTSAFLKALGEDNRNYQVRVPITLADGTVLNGTITTIDETTGEETVTAVPYLTNENIWEDGIRIDDAVSADNVFQVGAAIVNQATVVINNIYGKYDKYDFDGARVSITIGLEGLDSTPSYEYIKMGEYIVDEPECDGALITLKCLDNMSKFDRPYTFDRQGDIALSYPATLGAIVRNACDNCGVTLATNSLQFPHYDFVIQDKPSGETNTYRQIVSWAAQIAVCFARCNNDGQLEIKWYNTDALDKGPGDLDGGIFDTDSPYSSGDTANGGTFNPWSTGDVHDGGNFIAIPAVHHITSAFSHKVSTDDVVITKVSIVEKVNKTLLPAYASQYSSTSTYSVGDLAYNEKELYRCISAIATPEAFNRDHWEAVSDLSYSVGTDGYTISIEGNDLIQGNTRQAIATWMGTALIGLQFRKAEVTHPNNPSIEAGDLAYYFDAKGNQYTLIVSSTSFSISNSQRTLSSAETPAKNSQQRFSESTRNYLELRQQMEEQRTDFQEAQSDLARQIANAGGLFETDVIVDGATQRWCHDKPTLRNSEIVMAFTTAGITVCNDYKSSLDDGTDPTWYGLNVDGTLIASILNAVGVNADWINTGAFTVRDSDGNITFQADANTGSVQIKASNIPHQFVGKVKPTASNYPANQWTTDTLKEFHVGDLYTNSATKRTYRYTKGYKGIVVKFSNLCELDSYYLGRPVYDAVRVWYEYDGKYYVYPELVSDSRDSSIVLELAGAELFIPTSEYHIGWHSTPKSTNTKYGWKVASVTQEIRAELPTNVTEYSHSQNPASGYDRQIVSDTELPETEHPYSANYTSNAITVPTDKDDGAGYLWVEIAGVDISTQDILNDMTQEQIFNVLTNDGETQGLYLLNGKLYLNFEYAVGQTLKLGGLNDSNGLLQIYNSSNVLSGHLNNGGLLTVGSIENRQTINDPTGTGDISNLKVKISDGEVQFYNRDVKGGYLRFWKAYSSGVTLYAEEYLGLHSNAETSIELNSNAQGGYTPGTTGSRPPGTIKFRGAMITTNCAMTIGAGDNAKWLTVWGDLTVYGTFNQKARVIPTANYGSRAQSSYETATPYFGDIGTGVVGENGEAVISIDDIFYETTTPSIEYVVFLQKEGQGDVWVSEKDVSYFVVSGTPGLKFAWELKAVQIGHTNTRLEDYDIVEATRIVDEDVGLSMEADLEELDAEDLFDEIVFDE